MAYSSSKLISKDLCPSTKLRLLKLKDRTKLIQILNVGNSWQDLAGIIRNPDNKKEYLYSACDIDTLDSQYKCGATPAQSLLEHWSTCGRNQPTVTDLLTYLEEASLLRAADYVRIELLKIPSNKNDTIINEQVETHAGACVYPEKQENEAFDDCDQNGMDNKYAYSKTDIESASKLDNTKSQGLANNISFNPEFITMFCYDDLARLTQNFCNTHVRQGGCKIGEGSFGSVYRACIQGHWIAVKKLKDAVDQQFFTEFNVLTRFKNENLLSLLGFSNNGPYCCLVYAYMENGSLQERLACIDNTLPIPWKTRTSIACGVARGLNHLHTFEEQPLVHRDIKSANILLDENFVPKVGDFGLVRTGSTNNTSTTVVTKNIYGTSLYMPREALYGDVSVKLDSFSFGVVIIELLTGLPPYDPSREDIDLISHVEGCDNILILLDRKAGKWNTNVANKLYDISKLCLETRKKDRPTIEQVLGDLENIQDWES